MRLSRLTHNRFILVTLVCLSMCVVLGIAVCPYMFVRDGKTHWEHLGRNATLQNMEVLVSVVKTCMNEEAPPSDMKEVVRLLEDCLGEDFSFEGSYLFVDKETGRCLDKWGSPIRLLRDSPNHYILLSLGPNAKYDNGGGDDIVLEFNVGEAGKPQDANTEVMLYYRGLGINDDHSWYGKRRGKLIERLGHKLGYDAQDDVILEVQYYPSGVIESECPKRRNGMDADGIHRCFYENGMLAEEVGIGVNRDPECVGSTFMRHGVSREYDENGKLEYGTWFINDEECTQQAWALWLKKHPEHVLYGRVD